MIIKLAVIFEKVQWKYIFMTFQWWIWKRHWKFMKTKKCYCKFTDINTKDEIFPITQQQFFLFFLKPMYGRESTVSMTIFWNRDVDGFTRFEVPRIKKSHFQRLACVYVCVSVISITKKQNVGKFLNLVFCMCVTYRCYLNLFIKIWQIFCVQGYTKEFPYTMAYGRSLLFMYFNLFTLH